MDVWPLWLSYIAGATASLIWKLKIYVDEGGTVKKFFFRSEDSRRTSVVIFGSAWLVGAFGVRYFSGGIESAGEFASMPPHPMLFLLGALAEVIAPWVADWVVGGVVRLFGGTRE